MQISLRALVLLFVLTFNTLTVSSKGVELPDNKNILFWSLEQRDSAFRQMGKVAPANTIHNQAIAHEFEVSKPLDLSWSHDGKDWAISSYMESQRAAGIVVVHRGEIKLEQYALGFGADQRWTSFSVAKSFTSTLAGAAIKDGYIKSVHDLLTDYIPELKGSGYDGVTVENILTMQSGVRWNEDYSDPQSDVALFSATKSVNGVDPITLYMKTLQREAKPGARWQYNTGETNLIGVLVANATGKSLSQYLTEKVWQPFGMVSDAVWLTNDGGKEIGGCCISATVRDYARFGEFVLADGVIDKEPVVPEGWFTTAGRKQADIGRPGFGYGYQWWTYDDGSFVARGIFGQSIFIDTQRQLVIATNGNWPDATSEEMTVSRNAFFRAVQSALDR